MLLPADNATTLALWYHLNSTVWSNFEAYLNDPHGPEHKVIPDAKAIPLPAGRDESPLAAIIGARQSCRRYAARPMSIEQASKILGHAYGIVGLRYETPTWARWGRVAPSAGGLYPLEIYAATQSIEGVSDAVYHYNPIDQRLELVASCTLEDVRGALLFPEFVQHANLLLMISAVFERTLKKYGPRGYRYVLLEAGHCAQNVCLSAAESGLSSLCLGGFQDTIMNRSLRLDERHEAVVYCIGVGFGVEGD